jgi:hypothetical protein
LRQVFGQREHVGQAPAGDVRIAFGTRPAYGEIRTASGRGDDAAERRQRRLTRARLVSDDRGR